MPKFDLIDLFLITAGVAASSVIAYSVWVLP